MAELCRFGGNTRVLVLVVGRCYPKTPDCKSGAPVDIYTEIRKDDDLFAESVQETVYDLRVVVEDPFGEVVHALADGLAD